MTLRHALRAVDQMETKAKEFTLSGDYRRMMAQAEDLSWEYFDYKDPYADLQATDKDILAGRTNKSIRAAALTIKSRPSHSAEDSETKGGEEGGEGGGGGGKGEGDAVTSVGKDRYTHTHTHRHN